MAYQWEARDPDNIKMSTDYQKFDMPEENGGTEFQNFEFGEKEIRLGFIRKVYGILLCQLIVTMAVISIFLFVEPIKDYALNNHWMWYLALALTFVCLIALACCPDVRRTWPMNFIFLGVFTLCEAYLLGALSSCYDSRAVLIAAGATAVVALGLTIFAFQTRWDFTMFGGLLFVFLIVLILYGLLCAIIRSYYASMAYACIGALIFSFYIVFDTQLMLGGKHKYSISPEEYIFAALNLYLDVINLFMMLLMIIGGSRN